MSEKQKGLTAKRSGLEITDHKNIFSGARPKLVWLILCLIIVLTGIGALGYWWLSDRTGTENSQKFSSQQKAAGLVLSGKNDQAITLLNAAIAKSSSSSEKSLLYSQKSSIQLSSNDPKDSLQSAYAADRLQPTAGTAQAVADAASQAGDKATALKYYKLQLQRMQPVRNIDNANRVQAKITALEADQ